MSDEELVRAFFTDTLARPEAYGSWAVVVDPDGGHRRIGEGTSVSEAWSSAEIRLWKDEWSRAIICQLRAIWSEQPGRT